MFVFPEITGGGSVSSPPPRGRIARATWTTSRFEMAAYRYYLRRTLDCQLALDASPHGTVVFVMLNPSTADETVDDPTIRRCLGFARRLGAAELAVVNLYALRATDPRALCEAADPVGPENDQWIARAAEGARLLIAAWGAWPYTRMPGGAERVRAVRAILAGRRALPLMALGCTKNGFPRHPLYVPREAALVAV